MAVLRVSVAHTLSGVAAILFELFGSFGTVFSGPLGRFLQPLLPVGVQTVSIIPWALLELHQLLRGTGGIGLHISRYPPADRSQGRLGHTGVLFPQTAAGSSCRRRASSTAAGRRDCGPAPGPGGPAQVRPNLRKCKKSNYLPILDVFKDFAAIVVDDSPNHNRNLRKILIFSHVRLNNYNIPFYYNMWRTMQRRSEVSCRTKYL